MSTRREFFKQAAALSGGGSLAAALLASVRRASAIEPPAGSSYLDAEHVVILMQENRSFDHALGTLRGVRGFNDPRAVTLPDGNPVWLQSSAAGKRYAPFRLNIHESRITWLGSLPHDWSDQHDARNDGNHDKWLDAKPAGHPDCAGMPITMGHHQRDDIPFYYALADAFTVCDQHFCSSLTATTPNRLHLWTGTVREAPHAGAFARIRNEDTDYGAPAHWTTFPERLQDAGISWKIYQNEISYETGLEDESDAWLANFGDNPIEWFSAYAVGFAQARRRYLTKLRQLLPSQIVTLKERLARSGGDDAELKRQLHEKEERLQRLPEDLKTYTDENFARLPDRTRSLHSRAFTTNAADPACHDLAPLRYRDGDVERELQVPAGDVLYQLRRDVDSGTLPAVSWVVAPQNFSDHPSAPWFGAWYVSETMNILTRNPEVWKKTIFILTYDENDGYFDHVPPFTPPRPGNPDSGAVSAGIDAAVEYVPLAEDLKRHSKDKARGGPIGLGYRVPLVVASPWSRGGYVCSQVFDHTSVLQLLETVLTHTSGKPIRETNISAWRRTVCGDLSSVFEPARGSGRVNLPFSARDEVIEEIHRAKFRGLPGGFHEFTADEAGAFRRNPYASAWMPRQEEGVRPSRALPYQLYADGALSRDKKALQIRFEARKEIFGGKTAGGAFHVYTPAPYRRPRVRAYTVSPGDALTGAWELGDFENGVYHVRVCGPNGFYRELRGDARDPRVQVRCEYAPAAGDVELHLTNSGAEPLRFAVQDHSYGAAHREGAIQPSETAKLELQLKSSGRWYDFSLTIAGADAFERRYAGRVENGEPGISDPAMSGAALPPRA